MSSTYEIEALAHTETRLVRRNGSKVAILFAPDEPEGAYQLYPHPETFPDLTFRGLPTPLRPEFMSFASLADVETFLGIVKAARMIGKRLAA